MLFICRICLIEKRFSAKVLARYCKAGYKTPLCSFCMSEGMDLGMTRKDEYLRDITVEQLQRYREFIKDNKKFRKTFRDFTVERIDMLIQEKKDSE